MQNFRKCFQTAPLLVLPGDLFPVWSTSFEKGLHMSRRRDRSQKWSAAIAVSVPLTLSPRSVVTYFTRWTILIQFFSIQIHKEVQNQRQITILITYFCLIYPIGFPTGASTRWMTPQQPSAHQQQPLQQIKSREILITSWELLSSTCNSKLLTWGKKHLWHVLDSETSDTSVLSLYPRHLWLFG